MEKLTVRNFLGIRKADLELRRFNMIIGHQRNTLSKLIYFFRKGLEKCIINGSEDNILVLFDLYFPKYLWENQKFNIKYRKGDIEIHLYYDYEYSKDLKVVISESLKKLLKEANSDEAKLRLKNQLHIKDTVYIPAGRSFFSKITATASENGVKLPKLTNLDPISGEFAMLYSIAEYFLERNTTFNEILNDVFNGKVKIDKHEIRVNDQKIKLTDAPIEYQELIPALIVLSLPLKIPEYQSFIIEEPEVYLFPKMQRDFIFFISKIYNISNGSMLITTSSPYVLSSLNTLLLAGNVINESNKDRIEKLIGKDTALKFEDISAYEIENGIVKPFLNYENKLLDTNIIDEATKEYEDLFDRILEINLEN